LDAAADFNILVTATKGGASDDVNASTNGWGVDNQNINTDETITFSFVDDGDNTTAFGISDFKFQVTKWTGGFNGAIAITITYIDADTMGEETETIQFASVEDAVVQITGLTWLDYEAGDLLLDVQVKHGLTTTGGGFNLNGVEVGTESSTPPDDLSFEGIIVEVVDSDGDTDSQEFSVFIDGEAGDQLIVEAIAGTSGNDMLNGTSGEDALIAGAGNDILTGGEGDDFLTGGLGEDTFVFSLATDSGNDVITDFEVGTDVLSFVDVIDTADNPGVIDLGDVISGVTDDGTDITVNLTNGGSITLQGVGTGGVNDATALQNLLGADKINVDPS
jgi:Ca2+-binding RTX toxin-like protein